MIAGYVSPTITSLATVSRHRGNILLDNLKQFNNSDSDSLLGLLQRYLGRQERKSLKVCVAVPGAVHDNRVPRGLLPWDVNGHALRAGDPISDIRLVNEYEAIACGVSELSDDKFFTLNKGITVRAGSDGLIVIDDRIGEALILRSGDSNTTVVTEGHLAGFTPGSQLETELWQYLYGGRTVVQVRDVLCADGITRIFDFLVDSRRMACPDWYRDGGDRSAQVLEKALSESDPVAVETLDVFIDCLASEAANLVLRGGVRGNLYLGGMLLTGLIAVLDRGRFVERFARYSTIDMRMEDVSVHMILENQIPLVGAASMIC